MTGLPWKILVRYGKFVLTIKYIIRNFGGDKTSMSFGMKF